MRRGAAVLTLAVLLIGCAAEPVLAPAPAPTPAPAPAPPPPPPEPEPEPEPVELTAALAVDGGIVTVTGASNLPDGAVLVWELRETIEAFAEDPELVIRDEDGEIPAGTATVTDGAFSFTVTGAGWDALGLCNALPLELSVSYTPWRGVAELGALPVQPESLYALHGDNGERLPGAVPPAELFETREQPPWKRVRLQEVTCP